MKKDKNETKEDLALTHITLKRMQNKVFKLKVLHNISLSKTYFDWGKRYESIAVNAASKL